MGVISTNKKLRLPRLHSVNQEPLADFEKRILNQASLIETWFNEQWQKTPAPITTSIDLRHAGFKLAPVDTNLFPAGFNNLNPRLLPLCAEAIRDYIAGIKPGCERVLILPESHTRNPYYLHSLSILKVCLQDAGFAVRIGSLDADFTHPQTLQTEEGVGILIEPILRKNNRIHVEGFDPCVLLLNHDLSTGIPKVLVGLEQPIYPTSQLGWSNRLKSSHFDFYDGVTQEFSAHIGLDAWFINPLSEGIDGVDFMQQTGLDELAATVDNVLERVQTRFNQYGISESPFAIVKADNGTYGMSVMSVHKGSQLLELNRKQRTRMSARKGSQKVTRVLVQEGIYSVERINSHAVSEPVIYLIGPFVVGGFYRVHHERAQHESLNTPGMYFEPLSLKTPKFEDYNEARALIPDNRFYIYGVIARLATLAAAREMAASGGNR